jgi:hypothetical protein
MWIAVGLGAFAATQIAASSPFNRHPEEQLAVIESGGGLGVDVQNTTVFSTMRQGRTLTWFAERNSNRSNWCGRTADRRCVSTRTSSMEWIDGRRCAPVRDVLMQLRMVRTEERGSAHPWVSDTPLLSLLTFKGQGQLATERLSEYAGPFVDWWRSAQKQLQPCWTNVRPWKL